MRGVLSIDRAENDVDYAHSVGYRDCVQDRRCDIHWLEGSGDIGKGYQRFSCVNKSQLPKVGKKHVVGLLHIHVGINGLTSFSFNRPGRDVLQYKQNSRLISLISALKSELLTVTRILLPNAWSSWWTPSTSARTANFVAEKETSQNIRRTSLWKHCLPE